MKRSMRSSDSDSNDASPLEESGRSKQPRGAGTTNETSIAPGIHQPTDARSYHISNFERNLSAHQFVASLLQGPEASGRTTMSSSQCNSSAYIPPTQHLPAEEYMRQQGQAASSSSEANVSLSQHLSAGLNESSPGPSTASVSVVHEFAMELNETTVAANTLQQSQEFSECESTTTANTQENPNSPHPLVQKFEMPASQTFPVSNPYRKDETFDPPF